MREGHFTLVDSFTNGLRPDPRIPDDAPFMLEMQNARPREFGACVVEPVTNPVSTISVTWPFPQVWIGREKALVLGKEIAYDAQITDGEWAVTEIATYDSDSILQPKDIVAGGQWHIIDLGESWCAMNGSCVMYKTAHNPTVLVQDAVTVQTGCAMSQQPARVVMAGFDESDFWQSAWQSFWDDYLDNVPSEISDQINFSQGAKGNWVWWSSFGAVDVTWLWDPSLMVYGPTPTDGGYGPDNPYVLDLMRMNQAGMAAMPWPGTVLRVLPLGNGVAVYGDRGCSYLSPADVQAPTMRVTDIPGLPKGMGPAQRSSVAGGRSQHVLVDAEGVLWRVQMTEFGPQAQQLGYEEYLAPLLEGEAQTVVVSHDEGENEFWISNSTECYVLTPNGLGGPMDVRPTSLERTRWGLYGPHQNAGLVRIMELISHNMTLQEAGSKHITTFQAGSSDMTRMQGAVGHYTEEVWRPGVYKPFNSSGACFPVASFKRGRMKVKGKAKSDNAVLNRLEVRYNAEDRTFRRGTKGIPETD